LGFALIVLGFLLFIIALLGGSGISSCPANGCPPGAFQWYWVGIFAFFSGMALIIIGIILIMIAREMKPDRETDLLNRSEEIV
jgi:hypothetical protein